MKTFFALLLSIPLAPAWARTCQHHVPHAPLDTTESPVLRTVSVRNTINVPVDELFNCFTQRPLEAWFDGAALDPLQGVTGTRLVVGPFGEEASRRVVCLKGGASILEEVTKVKRGAGTIDFRYRVWNSTQGMARMMHFEHADGRFEFTDQGGRTAVTWSYRLGFRAHHPAQGTFADVFHRSYMKDGIKKLKRLCEGNH